MPLITVTCTSYVPDHSDLYVGYTPVAVTCIGYAPGHCDVYVMSLPTMTCTGSTLGHNARYRLYPWSL